MFDDASFVPVCFIAVYMLSVFLMNKDVLLLN